MAKRKPRKPSKPKTALQYVMSGHCRKSKRAKEVFLKWISQKRFEQRKPTVAEVIKECRRKGSRLRCCMEQSTQKAAQKYWRSEAQYLLRHVNVVRFEIETSKVLTKPIRAYIPINVDAGGHIKEENYIPALRVMEDPVMKRTVLERAHRDFLAWLDRYERYDEFMEEFSSIVAAYRKLRDDEEGMAVA